MHYRDDRTIDTENACEQRIQLNRPWFYLAGIDWRDCLGDFLCSCMSVEQCLSRGFDLRPHTHTHTLHMAYLCLSFYLGRRVVCHYVWTAQTSECIWSISYRWQTASRNSLYAFFISWCFHVCVFIWASARCPLSDLAQYYYVKIRRSEKEHRQRMKS